MPGEGRRGHYGRTGNLRPGRLRRVPLVRSGKCQKRSCPEQPQPERFLTWPVRAPETAGNCAVPPVKACSLGRTVSRRGHPRIAKFQAVVYASALGLRCEARPVQRAVEEVTGTISGKHTSNTISTMCSRRQAENEQACQRIAERRYRLPPVILVNVSAPLRGRNCLAMLNQARAPLAFNNLLVQRDKVLFVTIRDLDRRLHYVRRRIF